jgi:hypothetical protein
MELARTARTAIDISSEADVLSYAHTGPDVVEVIARVDLGSQARPIAGGGSYVLTFYIGDVPIMPVSSVDVDSDSGRAVVVSRPVPLNVDDEITIAVTGLAGDTAVDVTTTLRDGTPAKVTDLTGVGAVPVDHDYGGTDELAVRTATGAGVDGANVWAYRTEDYDAGRRGREFVVAAATTDAAGRWERPMLLDPGEYTLLVFKQGAINAKTHPLTVE